jgi:hypothetical protein
MEDEAKALRQKWEAADQEKEPPKIPSQTALIDRIPRKGDGSFWNVRMREVYNLLRYFVLEVEVKAVLEREIEAAIRSKERRDQYLTAKGGA